MQNLDRHILLSFRKIGAVASTAAGVGALGSGNSSTMIVMMMASTPSVNAFSPSGTIMLSLRAVVTKSRSGYYAVVLTN